MPRPLYTIHDWKSTFETSESRRVSHMRWVPVPNRHDGKSFRRVARLPNNVAVFCAFQLMLEVASKMPDRGVLADDDGPLDASDLSAMTGYPEEIFEQAFDALIDPKIAWLDLLPHSEPADEEPEVKRKGTRIPQPFEISETARTWATEHAPGLDLERERDQFVDYWCGVSGSKGIKLDWEATFRNSLRMSFERINKRNGGPPVDPVQDELKRRQERRESGE